MFGYVAATVAAAAPASSMTILIAPCRALGDELSCSVHTHTRRHVFFRHYRERGTSRNGQVWQGARLVLQGA
uniref:Putative secreted protein n=1 Tax=Anopheles darlingi TaxID=43151 RepID=A0A2M4DN46_ANODA